MFEQPSFDRFEPSRRPAPPRRFTPRELLFFAIHFGRIAGAQSTQLAYELIDLQPVPARPHRTPHCTLLPFGDIAKTPQTILRALLFAGAGIRAPSFEMTWDHVMRFGPEAAAIGPLVLCPGRGETELRGLQKALCSTVEAALPGFRVGWSFTPHVTLARTGFVQERAVEPIRLTVGKVSLVHSIQKEGRHEMLGSWPLRG